MLNNCLRYLSRNVRQMSSHTEDVIQLRQRYLTPSLRTFEAYDNPVVLERGKGHHLWDNNNNKYIDLLGQNLCISVGYGNPRVVNAAIEQINKLAHCTTMYYHEKPSTLAKRIVDKMPEHPSGEEWVVHLVNDGSEAVDLAVQMARVYTGRPEIIGLHKAYHGLHGYAAGLTAIGKSTQPSYASMFTSISHVESKNIEQLENLVQFGTGGSVGGIIIEPLQGFGGIHSLKDGYMRDAFELISKSGGVTISDEVQTGYGRCGESFWGFEMKNNDAIPDMITIAKGMGNGVGIIGAVVCRRSIAEAFSTKMFFNTYGSNPVASAVAIAVLDVMEEDNILDNCYNRGMQFREKINVLCNKYPSIYKEIRGSGLFQGLEIYGDDVEQSFYNAVELHKMMLNEGVIVGRGSAEGNVFRLQPPMCINEEDVDYVVESLEKVAIRYLDNF